MCCGMKIEVIARGSDFQCTVNFVKVICIAGIERQELGTSPCLNQVSAYRKATTVVLLYQYEYETCYPGKLMLISHRNSCPDYSSDYFWTMMRFVFIFRYVISLCLIGSLNSLYASDSVRIETQRLPVCQEVLFF